MKQMIFIISITILFIISSLYINKYLYKSAYNITSHINKTIDFSIKKDWKNAEKECQIINNIWNKTKDTWTLLIEHEEIDMIDSSLSKVVKYIQTENLSNTLAEISNLKLLLEHIPERFSPNLQNVL